MTTVPVVKVSGQSLFVRGLDAIDATPVLDIKPHAPGSMRRRSRASRSGSIA